MLKAALKALSILTETLYIIQHEVLTQLSKQYRINAVPKMRCQIIRQIGRPDRRVRISGGDLCAAEAPTETAAETKYASRLGAEPSGGHLYDVASNNNAVWFIEASAIFFESAFP